MFNDEIGPSCTVCRDPGFTAKRREWGCDRPAPDPVFATTCPRCHGARYVEPPTWVDGDPVFPECGLCGGAGEVEHHRCPQSLLSQNAAAAIESWRLALDGGHLLVPGGLSDQPPLWREGLRHFRSERDRMRAERAERMRQARG